MIIVNLDVMLAKRKMKSNELADKIGITTANLSILKTGRPKPSASPPPGSHLQRTRLPARRYPRIPAG